MFSVFYILDDKDQPIPATTDEYIAWIGDEPSVTRKVASDEFYRFPLNIIAAIIGQKLTYLITRKPPIRVSTVFLAIDHGWDGGPPVLWETMVFGDPKNYDYQERYTSKKMALAAHKRITKAVKRGDKLDG